MIRKKKGPGNIYYRLIITVIITFVQATFVLGTFVHISNISAVTGPIWIKL